MWAIAMRCQQQHVISHRDHCRRAWVSLVRLLHILSTADGRWGTLSYVSKGKRRPATNVPRRWHSQKTRWREKCWRLSVKSESFSRNVCASLFVRWNLSVAAQWAKVDFAFLAHDKIHILSNGPKKLIFQFWRCHFWWIFTIFKFSHPKRHKNWIISAIP